MERHARSLNRPLRAEILCANEEAEGRPSKPGAARSLVVFGSERGSILFPSHLHYYYLKYRHPTPCAFIYDPLAYYICFPEPAFGELSLRLHFHCIRVVA